MCSATWHQPRPNWAVRTTTSGRPGERGRGGGWDSLGCVFELSKLLSGAGSAGVLWSFLYCLDRECADASACAWSRPTGLHRGAPHVSFQHSAQPHVAEHCCSSAPLPQGIGTN